MAAPSIPHEAVFAIKENPNAWDGDAVSVDEADAGIEPNAPGIMLAPGREYEEDPALHGDTGALKMDVSNILPDFDIPINARWAGRMNLLLAMFFGAEATSSVTEGTLNVGTQHDFTLAKKPTKHGTLVANWGTDLLEMDHFVPNEISLSWSAGQRAVWSIPVLGRKWDDASAINTGVSSVTVTTPRDYWLSDYLTVQISAQSGSLAEVSVTDFTITLSQNLDGGVVTSGSAPYREQPYAPAPGFTGSFEFSIARWSGTTFQRAHRDGTLMKGLIQFLSSDTLLSGASTTFLESNFYLPQFQINDYEQVDAGTVGERISGSLTTAASAPTEMNSNTKPSLQIINNDAAYLS